MQIDVLLESYLTDSQLNQINHIVGYNRSDIYMNVSSRDYLPRLDKKEIEILFQKEIDFVLKKEQEKKTRLEYDKSLSLFKVNGSAIADSLSFFNESKIIFDILPGKLHFKSKKLHKKYKKHIFEFSKGVYNGSIASQGKHAYGFGLMPYFIDFLNKKYKKELIYIK